MKGHAVTNPIKVGRVFILRGARGVPPSVASAVDGTWVELLTSAGEHRRIETTLLGRAVTLPGYSATGIDLGGGLVSVGPSSAAVRGLQRGPARAERAAAQQDLRVFLQAALLDMIAQTQTVGTRPESAGGEVTRQEAAAWARMRVQAIDHHRRRGSFAWRLEAGRVLIDGTSFEAWLVDRIQREQTR